MPIRALWFFLLFTFVIGAFSRGHGQEYAIGADVSFARQAEQQGFVFKENGVATPVLDMLKAHGYNWVRLRLFYPPTDLPNNLDYTIATAKAAKKLGFHTLLDLHYSDTWADGTASYVAMIVPRLILMRELLADTGSIYVHIDYRVAHYLKIILDEVFGRDSRRLSASDFTQIGYVSENQEMPDWMTVEYFMNYLKPFYPNWDAAELEAELSATGQNGSGSA